MSFVWFWSIGFKIKFILRLTILLIVDIHNNDSVF